MTEIVYKSKNAVVAYKPAGIPSQPDPSGDSDAMTLTSQALGELGESTLLYPINRLDRVVSGLIVFARNKKSAAALSALASGEGMGKTYLAVIEGEISDGVLRDCLYKDARIGKAFVVDRKRAGVKEAVLEAETLDTVTVEGGVRSLVKIKLHTGRFHQIRAQLSSRGASIVGDGKYGSRDKGARMPALAAVSLSFTLEGEKIEAVRLPDLNSYPWSLFAKEKYDIKVDL